MSIVNGIHWPNGPEKQDMFALTGPTLMLASEARWHYNTYRQSGRTVVWRGLPRIGRRPAELNYDVRLSATECLNLWDVQTHGGVEHFVPFNELNLNYERGDDEDDTENLDSRMGTLVRFLTDIEPRLRSRLTPTTKLHFPAWVPDGRAYDRVAQWHTVASRYDVIHIHHYGAPQEIVDWVRTHLDMFPDKEVFLGEWHNDDPKTTLNLLYTLQKQNPRFIGATWFIAHWYDAPADWPEWKNAQDNNDLFSIFAGFQGQDVTMPVNDIPTWKAFAKAECEAQHFNWPTFEKQIQQESTWRQYTATGSILTSPSGAKGLGQISPTSHPNANWADPIENLRYAIKYDAANLARFGSYRKALAAYNWGPGNVGGYTDGQGRVHPAWDGTRSWTCPVDAPACATGQRNAYLDIILGPDWNEPTGVTNVPTFSVGPGLLQLMTDNGDSPATDELFFQKDGKNEWSEAFGQSGARYVYIASLNKSFRFPAD